VRPSPALVRRIDRLAKRAHAFHRFAHHPLCDNYAGELIALRGRSRVCRGCASAWVGGVIGVSSALALRLPALALGSSCAVVLCALLLAQATPWPAGKARPAKLWTRAVPAFLLGASVATCLRTASLGHICVAAGLLFLSRIVLARYRLRGPDRSPCSVCPERHKPAPCSGFRSIVRAERAFVRRSERLLYAAIDDAGSPVFAANGGEGSALDPGVRLGASLGNAHLPAAKTSQAGPFAT
jgi:hypothetical protein